jgi:hypothetical protein
MPCRLAAADWMQIRIGQAATCFSRPDDISSWRTVVERTARQNPEAVQPRVFPVGCRNHLGYAVSGIHRSAVAAGRGCRAGLTGWYSGGEDEGEYGEYRQDRK